MSGKKIHIRPSHEFIITMVVVVFHPLLSNRANSSYPQTDRPTMKYMDQRSKVFSILYSPAFIDNTGYKVSFPTPLLHRKHSLPTLSCFV